MKRLLLITAALVVGLGLAAPVALAADPLTHSGRVLVSTEGDVSIPAGDQADVVVVISGNAVVAGTVTTLVVVNGTATLTGASLETVVAVRSHVEIGDGTRITGELQRLDSTVHQNGHVEILGGITDLAGSLIRFGAALAPALVLIWLGFGVAMVVAALLLAALASRQVRMAERLISEEPLVTGLAGFVGLLVVPMGAVLLMVSLIGAPLGVGILFQVLPLLALAGYLVAAIWLGEWILRRTAPATRERPYLAAVIGVLVLEAIGLVPVLGLLVAIASLLGFGAVLRLGFRTMRGQPQPFAGAAQPAIAPTGA